MDMMKTMIAGVTALSLTLASATPAHSGQLSQDDIGKLLFGLVAAATLGAAIKNNNRDRDRGRQTNQARTQLETHLNDARPQRIARNPRILPRSCVRSIQTRFGEQRMFTRQCLRQEYAFTADLPRRCAVRVFANGGPVRGFDPHCLREQGYRARRH